MAANCADLGGSTCGRWEVDASIEVLGCFGAGSACTADRCDGTTLVSCVGGHEARSDCTRLGLRCFTRGGSDFDYPTSAFCATGTECKTSAFCGLGAECGNDYSDSCNGNTLTFCDVGKITKLNCAKAGWKSCVSDKQGTRCSP